MSSWMPFASITVPECVRLHGRSKPEPLNGSQLVRLGRRSMQTPLWASGASMRSKVPIATAPTMQSASSVPKVWSHNTFDIHSDNKIWSQCQSKTLHSSSSYFQSDGLNIVEYCSIFLTDNSVNIQGTWGPWSDWGPCPAPCGQVGVQIRSRNCQSRSMPCSGPKVEGRPCNGPECPRTGELTLI